MKGPQQLAGVHIKAAYVAFGVELRPRSTACSVRSPDHNYIIHD